MLAAVVFRNPLHGRSICEAMEGTGMHALMVQEPLPEYLRLRQRTGTLIDLVVLSNDGAVAGAPMAEQVGSIRSIYPDVPIIVVLPRGERNVVPFFHSGVDDVVFYPLESQEFLARAWAVTRRAAARPAIDRSECFAGPCTLKRGSRTLAFHDEVVDLTDKEFELAWLLFENVGKTVARATMLEAVWQLPPHVHSRCVDTCITLLRRKLRALGDHGLAVRAAYGVGYRLQFEPGHRALAAA